MKKAWEVVLDALFVNAHLRYLGKMVLHYRTAPPYVCPQTPHMHPATLSRTTSLIVPEAFGGSSWKFESRALRFFYLILHVAPNTWELGLPRDNKRNGQLPRRTSDWPSSLHPFDNDNATAINALGLAPLPDVPSIAMSASNRYGKSYRNGNGYGNFGAPARPSQDDYDPYGGDYGGGARYGPPAHAIGSRSSPALRDEPPIPARRERPPPVESTNAERQIAQVLEHIKLEWPSMCETDCVPVQLALQLLDNSSVGRAHEYGKFQETYEYLQESLKGVVHEHHQGFNSSIGTFHKIQGSIQASQKRVRALKESLVASKASLCTTDPELKKLSATSQAYEGVLNTLNELEELRVVPDQLEARISEKRFLSAVDVLQNALRKLRKPELDEINALSDLKSYLANQDAALTDILVEELHEHLYLKSPYCQERWQGLAKDQGAFTGSYAKSTSTIMPFHECIEAIDFRRAAVEDPAKNPEADTFSYIGLLVESLNKLGRLEAAVDILKQRMPVELFGIVNYTTNEVDQRHPSSLRGDSANSEGLHIYGSQETQMRAGVIHDLLWTLYGKFEAIAEAHRVFHETIKALIRREGAGNNSALLGSFKELWNLYQNEIKSLLHNYVTTDADLYHFGSSPKTGASLVGKKDAAREHLFKFSEADTKSPDIAAEYDALENIIRAAVPGLTDDRKVGSDKRVGSRSILDLVGSRKGAAGYEAKQGSESQKSLVEPSVFNMSLLLPPTLVFLQRLRTIVPPGSDLATSTLTTFLDNFLVNVFHPQLDETLNKLSDTIFGEADSFLQDQEWARVAKKPVFKGTTAFFTVVTAFCKMLATIPPDQALSSLIITQMMRYYDRCFGWYRSLVTKAQDEATDSQTLRMSATLALEPGGAINETIMALWSSENSDPLQLGKEIDLLISRADEKSLELSDVIQDKDVVSSLCMLYTSMKWLSVKTSALRHITQSEAENPRPNLSRQSSKRWTLTNDPIKTSSDEGPIHLPMTQETAQYVTYLRLAPSLTSLIFIFCFLPFFFFFFSPLSPSSFLEEASLLTMKISTEHSTASSRPTRSSLQKLSSPFTWRSDARSFTLCTAHSLPPRRPPTSSTWKSPSQTRAS